MRSNACAGRFSARLTVTTTAAILAAGIAVAASLGLAAGGHAAGAPVSVFPIPGSQVAPPGAQIAFRGVPVSAIGTVSVVGSRSGAHSGQMRDDSDGLGGSFIPDKPFTPGELVTVSTSLKVIGAAGGTYQFTVATPARGIPTSPRMTVKRLPGDVWRFKSQPGLQPPAVQVVKRSSAAAAGDIFVAPQAGPTQIGPMILAPDGSLVWFAPITGKNDWVTDFRTQTYQGKPVLTWWEGFVGAGVGVGHGVILDSSYRQIATVRAADGLNADLHEFQLSPQSTALITAYYPVYWNASSMGGSKRTLVLDAVVQEIDVPTGLLLFQWDSLDHVPVTESHFKVPKGPYDYFHINSIQPVPGGDLLISGRNTYAGYLIDRLTGSVVWRLSGKRSSFRMGKGATFAMQHDIRQRSSGVVTLFDNGAGPPVVHKRSRALTLRLDTSRMTATMAAQYQHSPGLLAHFEGDNQLLDNGDSFVGWGEQPYFTEFNSRGRVVFDARFVDQISHYRAYRFSWNATPATSPAVAGAVSGGKTTVYATWNGATGVASWRVLAGASATALRPVRTARKQGFETAIALTGAQRYVQVVALDGAGRTLGTSSATRAH